MTRTILITGSTDGIGLLTAKKLAAQGHRVLLHGRNAAKLDAAAAQVNGQTETYLADLSDMASVRQLAADIRKNHDRLDVLINNAGVLKSPDPVLADGTDIRFVVNTFAPYLLTELLLPVMPPEGRVVNLSSAAQAAVNTDAMAGAVRLSDMDAYAQSKLAITIWTREWARRLPDGPAMIAVNPGSLLATNMVKEGFGIAGNDLSIGADILVDAATGARFEGATGQYFDNDSGAFAEPHSAASDPSHASAVMQVIRKYADSHR